MLWKDIFFFFCGSRNNPIYMWFVWNIYYCAKFGKNHFVSFIPIFIKDKKVPLFIKFLFYFPISKLIHIYLKLWPKIVNEVFSIQPLWRNPLSDWTRWSHSKVTLSLLISKFLAQFKEIMKMGNRSNYIVDLNI